MALACVILLLLLPLLLLLGHLLLLADALQITTILASPLLARCCRGACTSIPWRPPVAAAASACYWVNEWCTSATRLSGIHFLDIVTTHADGCTPQVACCQSAPGLSAATGASTRCRLLAPPPASSALALTPPPPSTAAPPPPAVPAVPGRDWLGDAGLLAPAWPGAARLAAPAVPAADLHNGGRERYIPSST